jgi:CDP-diacylglycerol--serine O-phosphatidyltransferase
LRREFLMRPRMKQGILLVPSLLTTASVFAGFYALIAAVNGLAYRAGAAILLAMVFDALDGRVARYTRSASRFGLEYDALADLLSFGVAPGVLLYTWALQPHGRMGWLAVFLYVICGGLRLARFNAQNRPEKAGDFVGLPIPGAAGVVASTVMFFEEFPPRPAPPARGVALMAYCLAFLMVSNFRYRSFKRLQLRERRPFHLLVASVLLLVVVAAFPHLSLFVGLFAYALSGPAEGVWSLVRPGVRGLAKEAED